MESTSQKYGPIYPWFVAVVLSCGYGVSNLDRYLVSLVVEPIKADIGLTDVQVGLLQGPAFAICYALFGIPLGRMADVVSRRRLIQAGILFWSVATALCAFADSFPKLFAARLAVGLGEAALVPAALSLIGAYFAPDRLTRGTAVFTVGSGIGRSLAFLAGGALFTILAAQGGLHLPFGGDFRPWQGVFLAASIPGILVVLLMQAVDEPARVVSAGARQGFRDAIAHLARYKRAYALHVSAVLALFAAINAEGFWIVVFFIRRQGLTVGEAGGIVGTVALLVGFTAPMAGGWVTDRLTSRGIKGAPALVLIGSALLMLAPLSLFAVPTGTTVAICAYFGLHFCLTSAIPPAYSGIQMLTPVQHRGTIMSMFMCLQILTSLAVGTSSIGVLNDYVFGAKGVGQSLAAALAIFGLTTALCAAASRMPYRRALSHLSSAVHA